MKYKPTKSQTLATETRGQNILVSAAAGSGKTAVLVERIIYSLLREKDPVDVDRILVMTFTKAAAGEMRERIMRAINERLRAGGNSTLYRQAALVHNAHISTIHGFCLDVIKNHFHRIDLTPDFRTMEEAEGKLMMQDVLQEVLEEAYEKGYEAFLRMSEKIATGKNDKALLEAILKLHEFAVSNPDVEGWFDTCIQMYTGIDAETFEEHPLVKAQVSFYLATVASLLEQANNALAIADAPGGPYMYHEAIAGDIAVLEELNNARCYSVFSGILALYHPITLGRAKKDGPQVDEALKEACKDIRDSVKASIQKMQGGDFAATIPQQVALMNACREDLVQLLEITRTFYERFNEKKRKMGLIDFNDMEHLCLKIFTDNPSIAKEYRDFFVEIYVDEYQDSNYVQEAIVNAIAKDNVFNVGDVKQSIYGFRMARPDLFLSKYAAYRDGNGGMRIDLQENFRSRIEVVRAVNEVFEKIMVENPSKMIYDEEAALKYGATYYDKAAVILSPGPEPETTPEEGEKETQRVENNSVINGDYENITGGTEATNSVDSNSHNPYVAEYVGIVKDEAVDDKELEAAYIAERISELISSKMLVYDKQLEGLREIRYSDIVILLRATTGWDEKFCSVIEEYGIPIHAASSTGYFSAREIVWILSYLKVIDNPLQDIPLAAALHSPIGKVTEEELALIRAGHKNGSLYQSLCDFCAETTDEVKTPVIVKITHFLDQLEAFRKKTVYTSVYEILQEIIDGDYGREILASSGGSKRYANLNMLLSRALEFEKTSYRGLFQFVRYMEYLRKNEIDYGEANLLGENDNTVRLMSIHKSKGLEFPVVFVAAMHKGMNFMDAHSNLVLDSDLGVGMNYVDLEKRTKMQTLPKSVISRKLRSDTLAEEIRVFYVAMTRAREKLIMTGMIDDENKPLGKRNCLLSADSYLALLANAVNAEGGFSNIEIRTYHVSSLVLSRMVKEISLEEKSLSLLRMIRENETKPGQDTNSDTELTIDTEWQSARSDAVRKLAERLHFAYPFDPNDSYGKISVSELKKRSMEAADKDEYEDGEQIMKAVIPLIPNFLAGEKEPSPTKHGTAFHRMLEIWDYTLPSELSAVEGYFETVRQNKRMEADLLDLLKPEEICDFLKTDLADRMKAASARGELFREQPFVIRFENEMLIQGIIDAYFIEENRIVVVDYKTDRIYQSEKLIENYHVQLDYYAKALEKLTDLSVKEKILYSATLKRELPLL